MELSKRVLRQVENLSKSFEFNMEKRIAIIPLHYETPEELIDMHLSSPGKPIVSDETIDYLCEVVSAIPEEFAVDFRLTIDDYGKYDHSSLMNALRSTLENTFYYYDENRKKDNVLAVIFLIIGILLLAFETVGGMVGWYGESGSISDTVIETIIDVMVWVLTWEGAALLFLTYENDATIFGRDVRRFNAISFQSKEGEVLCRLDEEEFYKGWVYLGKKEIVARNFILFSNAALLAVLSILTVEVFAGLEDLNTLDLVSFIISWLITILMVLSNFAFYRECGRLKKYALAVSVVSLAYNTMYYFYDVYWTGFASTYAIWDFVLIIILAFNVISVRYMNKQSVKIV